MSFSVTAVAVPDNAVTSRKIAPNEVASEDLAISTIQYAEVEISAVEIKALNTAPKTLVAAPGANKVLEFISCFLALDWSGGTAYTIGSATTLQVKFTDGSGAAVGTIEAVSGFLDQSSDQLRSMTRMESSGIAHVANAPLVLHLAGAEVTLGDSPIHAKVAFRVHSTGL